VKETIEARVRKGIAGAMLLTIAIAVGCDSGGGTEPTLSAPLNITVTPTGPTSINVTWDPAPGASAYEIERATGSAGAYAQVGTATIASYDDEGLSSATDYRYRVIATSGTLKSTPSNPSSLVRTGDEGPKVVEITDDITADRTFYADTTYILSGFIKVGNGATLTIQPGTVVQGDFQVPGSSLFVLRGAKIMAEGTADNPIVFTSEREPGQRQPGDWGGIIIIGNGIINRSGSTAIEGTGTPSNINPIQYYDGGTDNSDDSGVLRYVRIEFAGYPTAPNEELNSLTMAAVGAGTTIEYVQVLQGLDDSFEWFGGAVNGRYLVSYESADDHFDASEGYVGRNQFLIAFQSIRPEARPGLAGGVASDPQLIENDGCWAENCAAGDANRGASQPYTVPVFANFTLIGAPEGAWETTGGNYGMMLRRGTGGLYVNGVIARVSRSAISFRGEQTKARHDEGNLRMLNLYVSQAAGGVFQAENLEAAPESRQYVLDLAAAAIEEGTVDALALFTGIPANTLNASGSSFDWTPAAGSPIRNGGLADFSGLPQQLRLATTGNGHPNSEIVPTTYRGAADPNGPKWWEGWTTYARN
jgi:hypothetical protein